MEERANRGRGGSWKRGGSRGRGNEGGCSGEQQTSRGGRGRQRGRGKRDHYRGRGRGGGLSASNFSRDERGELELEDEETEKMFPRRKLESNWDRYEEPEKEEKSDDIPTQRGTDYHVLLETAGDSYSQFRFSEEIEWETDSFAASMLSAIPLDLEALAQLLAQSPLHERLNLEPELVQRSTPADLPSMTMPPKQDLLGQRSMFKPPAPALKGPSVSLGLSSAASPISSAALLGPSRVAKLYEEDIDEDLDQLLGLDNPVSELAINRPVCVEDEPAASPAETPGESEKPAEDIRGETEGKEAEATPLKTVSVKQEVTEEDLEDWLDSMIS